MGRSGPEVADIFRRYGAAWREQHWRSLSTERRAAMTAIERCRTAALGGHVEQCDHCGERRISYNSCRSRNCPKCQSLARAEWIEARQAELLDTQYFHVVFTIPDQIAAIAFQNAGTVYDIMFRTAAETLRTIAADPKHLGAEIGFFSVLHTWGQNLLHHPHLHCVVPGGGLSPDGSRWIACRPGFFLPVAVLSRLFRRLFLSALQKSFDTGELQFFSSLQPLRDPAGFQRYLNVVRRINWVIYAKPPFGSAEQVVHYVGRYTHRVAISNSRVIDIEDGKVRFRWKDYRHGSQQKVMTLDAGEFIRRFLIHVLPEGFKRIRYYGFLGNRYRKQKLARCRELLGMISADAHSEPEEPSDCPENAEHCNAASLRQCPSCHQGHMVCVEVLQPGSFSAARSPDTS
ncbi:IS91 family transposase [Bradyrhizobium sp. CB82]|uniref:IS91 family transposase n=1 Tax=Bradyrhizobium sp. CB82 TaxID=3039159 RepID=UPI0024B0BFE5|nr:IS91 family transposase [Bradyrhizobium sp. CB82]WFU42138.1 IS91 family transposase [Bradyrhizobium sp. CB82]